MVALLILTHQARVHNLITIAGYEARIALFEENAKGANERSASRDNTMRRVKASAEPLVRAMLFADEVSSAGRIAAVRRFARLPGRGPRERGAIAAQLDRDRLFTYR